MGPVTRSSQRNKVEESTGTKNVLADKTNMPRMPKANESQKMNSQEEKTCVYSNVADVGLVPQESSNVYDFVSTGSPPRNTKKKRKAPRKKKQISLCDTVVDETSPIKPLSLKLRSKVKKENGAPVATKRNGNNRAFTNETENDIPKPVDDKIDSKEDGKTVNCKEEKGISGRKKSHTSKVVSRVKQRLVQDVDSLLVRDEVVDKRNTNSVENKITKNVLIPRNENVFPVRKATRNKEFCDKGSTFLKSLNETHAYSDVPHWENESDYSYVENKENSPDSNFKHNCKEGRGITSGGDKKQVTRIKQKTLTKDVDVREEEINKRNSKDVENEMSESTLVQKSENSLPLRERTENKDLNYQLCNKSSTYLKAPDKNSTYRYDSHFGNDSDYNYDIKNKENSPGSNFKRPRCMLELSPIEQDVKDNFVTKRQPNKRPCVQDFTVKNCFGFDESEDEVDLLVGQSSLGLPFSMSSTPCVRNKSISTFKQLPRFVLPAHTAQYCTRIRPTALPQSSSKNVTLVSSTQNSLSEVSIGSSVVLDSNSKQKRGVKQINTIDKYFSVSSKENMLAQPSTSNAPAAEVHMSEEVTSTVSPDPCEVLFEDKDASCSFSEPPRRSYERRASRVVRDHSSEADNASEDEVCNIKRTKTIKKQKVKEAKNVAKWAANVSAEFEEIDSFELCVE